MSAMRQPVAFPPPVIPKPAADSDADLVQTPNSLRIMAWTLAALIVLTLAVLAFAPWQQSVSGTGRVTALTPPERQQSIDAPVEGRVVKWHVVEGQRVAKGDPVVEIADIDPTLPMRLRAERDAAFDRIRAVSDREVQLEGRILELEQSLQNELAAADFRTQQASDRVRGAEQALQAGEARALVARQNLDRHRALFPKGLVSQRQLEVAQAEGETAGADLKRAHAALDEARNFQRTAEAERARAVNTGTALIRDAQASRGSARSDIASARQALQPIEVRLNRQAMQAVLAPADGTIFRLVVQPGSAVIKAGDEIASFVPENTSPVVELLVNGNDMPLLRKGRAVRLQFEGWPAVQFIGWPSVAVGTFGARVLLVDSTDDGKGKFRVLAGPDPNDEPWPTTTYLRQGVRSKGWILLDTVPLGFELWRQFNGFPPTAGGEAVQDKGPVSRKSK
ncbi:MAG: HlyD family efflux transporter periplasmic adaptor subunit [Bryobacteraceae bacterium]|nr:HlyD family efflux transporter periplasmic adaptor subunit [Bryobacteraceae bacterium]